MAGRIISHLWAGSPRIAPNPHTIRGHENRALFYASSEGGLAVLKKLTLVAICLAYPWAAMAQDAKTVIASAQKALGDVKAITYSGSAKDVSFQQCGANAKAMVCQGTHDPMRPIDTYVRVVDLSAPATRHTGVTNNQGVGGSTAITAGTFFQQVTDRKSTRLNSSH